MISQFLYSQNFSCTVYDSETQELEITSDCSEIELTLEEILCLPNANFNLAFHFRARENGKNFTCDPDDPILDINPLIYAPDFS